MCSCAQQRTASQIVRKCFFFFAFHITNTLMQNAFAIIILNAIKKTWIKWKCKWIFGLYSRFFFYTFKTRRKHNFFSHFFLFSVLPKKILFACVDIICNRRTCTQCVCFSSSSIIKLKINSFRRPNRQRHCEPKTIPTGNISENFFGLAKK